MDDFRFQLSVKVDGQHLLNIRADNEIDFWGGLRAAVENAELIQSAARALEGSQKAQAPAPVVTTHHPTISSPVGVSAEIGPILVAGVSISATKKDGTPMKSPKFAVKFGNGKTHSTFDAAIGQSAQTLSGQNCYYVTERKGEYDNLIAIRSAS
jgi:hypothetical protein